MFNLPVLFVSFIGIALADVSHLSRGGGSSGAEIAILRQESDISPEGNYQWAYETANGIQAQEQGVARAISQDEVAIAAQGSFAYTSPEGEQIALAYVADENGFQPQGAHLPTPPPIPPAIQRALEYIAAHPQPEEQNYKK